jgi:hypothetical protein
MDLYFKNMVKGLKRWNALFDALKTPILTVMLLSTLVIMKLKAITVIQCIAEGQERALLFFRYLL